MKEAMGTIGVAVATAPTMSASIAPSISTPSFGSEFRGGSFMPKTTFGSLFKDTVSFSASTGSIPEGPISAPKAIFSESSWATIVKPKSQVSILEIVAPDTRLFKAIDFGVREGPVKIKQSEFLTIAKVSTEQVTSRPQDEFTTSQMLALVRSALLAEQTGQKTKSSEKIAIQVQPKLQETPVLKLIPNAVEQKVEKIVEKTEDELKPKKKKEEEKDEAKEELLPQELIVDEKIQANRKLVIKDKIVRAFKLARLFKATFVSGKEFATSLQERREYKSRLLYQLKAERFSDGSFNQLASEIYALPSIGDLSENGQLLMLQRAEKILDANRAVKFSDSDYTKSATTKEAKKVLRFVDYFRWLI